MTIQITKAQYERAKKIVHQYEAQQQKPVLRFITAEDVEALWKSFQIPYLTEELVDEGFCSELEELITSKGILLNWVNLDDSGFISISPHNEYSNSKEKVILGIIVKSVNELIKEKNELVRQTNQDIQRVRGDRQ